VIREWFVDARDEGRRMEVSWHPSENLVIISLWHGNLCRSTFRMPIGEAPTLVEMLVSSLKDVLVERPSEPKALEKLFIQPQGSGTGTAKVLALGDPTARNHEARDTSWRAP
jgi:hypothetical protein